MKEKQHVPIWDNLKYMYRNWWKWNKIGYLYCGLRVPVLVLLPMLTALIPKLMIDCITQQRSPLYLSGIVVAMSLAIAGLSWIGPYLQEHMKAIAQNTRMNYRVLSFHKVLHTDFENIESMDGRLKFEKSKEFAYGGSWAASQDFYETNVQMFGSIVGVISYTALLGRMGPVLMFIILSSCILEVLALQLLRKAEWKHWDERHPGYMTFDYLYRTAIDVEAGKDIRIYNAREWLLHVLAEVVALHAKLAQKLAWKTVATSSFQAVVSLLRDLAAYFFLIRAVLGGDLSVADFIFYFGIVTGFSAWIMSIAQQYNDLAYACRQCQHYRDFLDIPEREVTVNPATAQITAPQSITFRDVTFAYNQDAPPVLRNVNLQIKRGEKIAIVGENGAGKTTLIKLLCGFYQPTSGEILIDGIPASNFDKLQYFSLFSAVFQDFNFLPLSIATNIALQEEADIDQEKLQQCLQQAGIWEKVSGLPQGLSANMVKEVHEDAENFSGGEKQKLLLARALYQDAPVLVLDEPTAALDPIAENNLYERYDTLMQDKTSFFISHRLSSTRFCDRILYIGGGTIAEEGTHEELLAQQGDYWRMYETQSYYYRLQKEGMQYA